MLRPPLAGRGRNPSGADARNILSADELFNRARILPGRRPASSRAPGALISLSGARLGEREGDDVITELGAEPAVAAPPDPRRPASRRFPGRSSAWPARPPAARPSTIPCLSPRQTRGGTDP